MIDLTPSVKRSAVRDGQYNMTEIAIALELSVSRVSRIARRVAAEAKDKV